MTFSEFYVRRLKRLRGARRHSVIAAAVTALLLFILAGLIYNAIGILRLPQSGLKTLQIIWVSFTACVVVILLATALAAGLEQLGETLRPKPPREDWLREEVRQHRIAGIEVAPESADTQEAGRAARLSKSSAA